MRQTEIETPNINVTIQTWISTFVWAIGLVITLVDTQNIKTLESQII